MLSPFARVLVYYLGAGFALGLFCSLWFFDRPWLLDAAWDRRLRRRAWILEPLGVLHPVVALTALGLASDARRDGDATAARGVVVAATGSLVASTAVAATMTIIVG